MEKQFYLKQREIIWMLNKKYGSVIFGQAKQEIIIDTLWYMKDAQLMAHINLMIF